MTDVIFRQLEVIESVVFLVFEKVVFLNVEKKKSIWSVSVTNKVGKMGWLLKILRVLWYFYFATHVQFLVGNLTKQVADMERVSHRIRSLLTKRIHPDRNIYQI